MKHTLLSAFFVAALAAPALATDYMIMAPAAPGGGWDSTARSMQEVMQAEGIAGSVQVQNVPGAGGTVGLAQFASTASGDPSQLIVGGYVMVGAILTNSSPVTLADVTPIARLTGEAEGIAVSASSPIQTIGELVEMMKADPGSVSWAGGSAGGVDHITVGLLAKAAGIDPTKINYVAFSGGGEALAAILGNQVAYTCQSETPVDRAVRAANKRRVAMGSEPGMGSFVRKPKGMHWSTYWRHMDMIESADDIANLAFINFARRKYPGFVTDIEC
ncbi:tripartite tricarboxylate transporter substrate-binding protein [Cypionkella sp. TWP1-2-1b2]|uniref:tripartite tricarboxylate transporter substrate-binding protein n=1 Tax=Cypionkella sp. TWP1-2-1b2 TaxID=2804675 RepID=UPI003CF02237